MKSKLLKVIIGITLTTIMVSSMVACGEKTTTNKTITSKPKTSVSIDKEKVQDATEKNVTTSKTNNSNTDIDTNGKLYQESIPAFEKVYSADPLKDFKLGFAKESINKLDKSIALLPAELKGCLFTSKGLLQGNGPMYEYNLQASGSHDNRNKNNCFSQFFGELTFYDSKEYLYCNEQISLKLEYGTDTNVIIPDEAKKIFAIIMPEYSAETLQAKANEAAAANKDGKALYLIEEKNKTIYVSNTSSSKGNEITFHYEINKDYPQ